MSRAPTAAAANGVGGMTPRRAKHLVGEIAKQYFGEKPHRIVQRGGGLTNLVFEFHVPDGEYIVRLNAQPQRINHFLKEQWAMAQARRAGVPVPEVLEVDNQVVELPYMVSRKLHGGDATHHPERLRLLGELGRLAAKLHTVRTHGHGQMFDWSSNQLSHCASWGAYLDNGMDADARLVQLQRARMLSKPQADSLHEALAEMRRWRKPPVLNHGDLRLKNLVVDDAGEVQALIDWDESVSAPAPYWDVAIALHDLNDDEKEAFLDGYGMTPRVYAQALRFLRLLNVLHYGIAVEQLVGQKDRTRIAWYRTRMQGQFDLFAQPAA